MQRVLVQNLSRPEVPQLTARYCSSFGCRLRGLTFRRSIPDGWGLLLVQPRESRLDSAIHMFAVLLDLAVIWINTEGIIVDQRLARRWRPAYMPRNPARYILETSPNRLDYYRIGEKVHFEPIS